MKSTAVVTITVEEFRRVSTIVASQDSDEAIRYLTGLDKKITELTEPR